jgi:serine/threonine-protein kinase
LSIGTPTYMSPEQTSAGTVDARSSRHSLATVLYEMLTGELPFTGTARAIVARRFAEPVRPLRFRALTIPSRSRMQFFARSSGVPADRFPDVAAFAAALRRSATPTESHHDP